MLTPEQNAALRIVRELAEEHVPAGRVESLKAYLDEIEGANSEAPRVVTLDEAWTVVGQDDQVLRLRFFDSYLKVFHSREEAERCARARGGNVARLVIPPPDKIAAKPAPDREGWWMAVESSRCEVSFLEWWPASKIHGMDWAAHVCANAVGGWRYFGPLDLPQKKEPAK